MLSSTLLSHVVFPYQKVAKAALLLTLTVPQLQIQIRCQKFRWLLLMKRHYLTLI